MFHAVWRAAAGSAKASPVGGKTVRGGNAAPWRCSFLHCASRWQLQWEMSSFFEEKKIMKGPHDGSPTCHLLTHAFLIEKRLIAVSSRLAGCSCLKQPKLSLWLSELPHLLRTGCPVISRYRSDHLCPAVFSPLLSLILPVSSSLSLCYFLQYYFFFKP